MSRSGTVTYIICIIGSIIWLISFGLLVVNHLIYAYKQLGYPEGYGVSYTNCFLELFNAGLLTILALAPLAALIIIHYAIKYDNTGIEGDTNE